MNDAGTTTDHQQIADSMRSIEYRDGACASVYKADGAQFLGHQMVAESFAGDGSLLGTYDVRTRDAG
jgi:hypothetical protein